MNGEGNIDYRLVTNKHTCLRLAFNYSEIMQFCQNERQIDNGVLEAEFGSILKKAAPKEMQEELDQLLMNKELKSINKFPYKGKYEYENERYDLVNAQTFFSRETLSNGVNYQQGDSIWVKEEPNIILIDQEKDRAIFKDLAFGGVPFEISGVYDGNFESTTGYKEIQKYLVNEFETPVEAVQRVYKRK